MLLALAGFLGCVMVIFFTIIWGLLVSQTRLLTSYSVYQLGVTLSWRCRNLKAHYQEHFMLGVERGELILTSITYVRLHANLWSSIALSRQ